MITTIEKAMEIFNNYLWENFKSKLKMTNPNEAMDWGLRANISESEIIEIAENFVCVMHTEKYS